MISHQRKKHKMFGGYTGYYTHESKSCRTSMNFSVFVPEVAAMKPVPVLYVLSGLTCTEENFMVKSGAQKYAAEHGIMLVACDTSPRGLAFPGVRDSWDFGEGAGFYITATEAPWADNFNMYEYVLNELPAVIESDFPALAGHRSIMGHSMGGHGALVLAFRNAERYQSVSAFSPIASPTRCPWGEKAFSGYLGLDRKKWEAYDAALLIGNNSRRIPLLIDQGAVDEFLDLQLKPELLLQAAHAANYPVDYRLREGYDHSYYFISTFIPEHIAFHTQHLKKG